MVLSAAAQQTSSPQIPAAELVRSCVHNEVVASTGPSEKHMFRSHKQTPKGSQTHMYVETKDAMAGMLVAVDDHPISARQQQGEENHLDGLVNNPEQLRKKHAHEKEDSDRMLQIVKSLPDAFVYQYANAPSGGNAPPTGDPVARLSFKPNPSYVPPSHTEQVLTGMEGYLLIDTKTRRLVQIDGTLFKDVTFGWGILGRLDKGGHFMVEQADVGDNSWEVTEMKLNIIGRIMLVKGFSMISDEVFSDFRKVPDTTTFAQAVKMLKTQEEKPARAAAPNPSEMKNTRQ